MGMTNFYQGSLRYSPCGRKRKNHLANPVKKKPIQFKKMKVEKTTLDIMRAEQAKQYKSLMEEAIKDGTFFNDDGGMRKKENPKYTGTLVKGIATMHKSNAVPVINQKEAEDIAKMRRG
tara:strand:+ start:227 stop:583 length:357 start_codon:yes stop_codon:yes gene_type:complete